MFRYQALVVAAVLGGSSAGLAQTAETAPSAQTVQTAPGSLAEASSFFKAPALDGCRIPLEDLVKGGAQALRGQWILRKGPGEMAVPAAGRIHMEPMPQRSGELVNLTFRNGRLVVDSPVAGMLPISVRDRAPPEPGSGLRAASVGRGDLPEGAEVFLDEVAIGRLPCGPDQLLQLRLQAALDTATPEPRRADYRLFLIDATRISGTYRETGPAGHITRGLVTLERP